MRNPQKIGSAFLAVLVPLGIIVLVLLPRLDNWLSRAPSAISAQKAQESSERLFDRLQQADTLLRIIANDIDVNGTVSISNLPQALTPFGNVVILNESGATTVIKGASPGLPGFETQFFGRVRSGRTALSVDGSGNQVHISLLRSVASPESGNSGLLYAELSPDYLWRGLRGDNVNVSLCVRDSSGRTLFCDGGETRAHSTSSTQAAAASSTALASEDADATATGTPVRAPVATLFGDSDWFVTVTGDNSELSTAARVYLFAGMLVAIIALLLARLWVGATPAAAKTIPGSTPSTQGKPDTAASQKTAAEPTGVPASIGAKGASRSASALRMFAEIDRAILSGAMFDRIADSIISEVCSVLPGDVAAIAVLDRNKPSQCRLVVRSAENKRQAIALTEALDAASTGELATSPEGLQIACEPQDALLEPFHKLGMRHCLLYPIFKDGTLVGALILGFASAVSVSEAERSLARDLAQRFGVAYTSADRGQELLFHSLYDSTTELPNRKFFETRLDEELSRARRESSQLALLLIDLDDFKKVNDSFGHDGGDILLEEASLRLKSCLRTEDLVARVGNDEFGVMLPTISHVQDASRVAEKLLKTLSRPYTLGGREQKLSATIGIALFPDDGKTPQALFRSADFAMNSAKQGGGGKYAAYEPSSNEKARDQIALSNDLRGAISKNELTLYFQPQIDLTRGEIVGAEALVRWQHRTRGIMLPSTFITIAEQSDVIEELGTFVRREASQQLRQWEKEGTAPTRVSVNVSTREFKRPDFLELIENALKSSGMRPFSLELEITESLLMEKSDQVTAILKALTDRGVRIAIDDFGTGYSSMSYLKDLPFNVLKIDRTFVSGIGTGDGSESIIEAIIGMAKALGKEIIAEGIETEAQRAYLATIGCDLGQGYLWSPPIPATNFSTFMRSWNEAARRIASIS